ncbi:hypothetical protein CWI38_0031p0010 [Hamiltosporidium tvaerminnensis]|uniref:Uncharacterized protein n=1 Tax=Hamiltosporidium tvaerminnensis TaxID=1176355 RepID=A0A4Q9M206_9MICR|nr:hypothetical protein CWI38_0031p0010 [Hamiltosporidium tvaerminnensis]
MTATQILKTQYLKDIVIYNLLTNGIYNTNEIVNIIEINEYLRDIGYEAIYWYDKSCIILKNTLFNSEHTHEYLKSNQIEEIKDFFKNILISDLSETNYKKYSMAKFLIQKRWIEIINGKAKMTKMCLIQNTEYLISITDKCTKCSLCDIIVLNRNTHEYCERIYNERICDNIQRV